MQSESNTYLSVVIPAYNEELRLPRTLIDVFKYLIKQSYSAEVLVVDDGSTDGTARIVQEWLSDKIPLRLITYPDKRNYGKGAAVRRGMLEAQGQFHLFMDADNSTTINHIECFWPFFEDGYDIVIGSRGVAHAVIASHQSWYRELAGKIGNRIIQALVVPRIADTQAGFKMFTHRCVEDLFPRLTINRWGFDVEILAAAQHHSYRIKEVPITWTNDPESKVTLQTYFEVLKEVWQIRRNIRSGFYK